MSEATPSPAVGDVVPAFEAQAIDGKARRVGYGKGSTTVVLFFTSGCPVCHRMLPLWNDAYARKAPGLEVVGVLLDQEPPGFFTLTPVAFPVVRSPGRAFLDTYKIARVPATLRVAEGGRIEDVGVGQLDPIRLGEIFRPPSGPASRKAHKP